MQKRSEINKQEKALFMTKLKHTAIVVLCIMFALSAIYSVDIATYKLVKNDKDQYAMRVTRQNESILRVDIVGSRFDFDIKNIIAYSGRLSQAVKNLVTDVKDLIR